MAKVSVLVHLFVFVGIWHTIACQELCMNNPCACCKNNQCQTNNNNYCTDGCIDGIWGDKCYNDCHSNCRTCTQRSTNRRLPCTSCIPGRYIGRYQDISSQYYNDECSLICRSECISCSSYNNCSECISGRYGTSCGDYCYEGCDRNKCDKEDGKCKCIAGYHSHVCKQCASNEYGKYPDCTDCPTKCLTCSSSVLCDTCVDEYYNGYNAVTHVTVDDCSNQCHINCKTCSGYDLCRDCNVGFWGQKCEYSCSNGCASGTCYNNNGYCKCKTRWFKGDRCEQCVAGRYGNDCNNDCSSLNCGKNECDRLTGTCSYCKVGYYGNDMCDKECSSTCKKLSCDFNDGACTDGCISEYSGDKCCLNNNNCKTCSSKTHCSECATGYSGDKCCVKNDRCIRCSSPSACFECKPGYSGDKCCLPNDFCETCSSLNECLKCIDGRHGTKCAETCPDNCADRSCRNNGHCYSCKAGFYGKKCENKCLQNCRVCNPNGDCKYCTDGYYGTLCDKCLENCVKCNSQNYCLACVEGYFGNNCDRCPSNCITCSNLRNCKECNIGYYEYTCQRECSNCKKGTKCQISDGECEEACKDGRYGSRCNYFCDNSCSACQRNSRSKCTVCANGRYGKNERNAYYNCDNYCSFNCLNNACNESTGDCDTCIAGYKGDLCDCPVNCHCTETGKCITCMDNFANIDKGCTECALHKYGVNCQSECNNNCLDNDNNTNCHGTNGTCIVGCVNGFYGDQCDSPCDGNCVKGTCSRPDGICSYGCKDGFTDSEAECVIASASVDPDGGGSSGSAIGGTIGGIIALIAGVLVFVFVRRRRANNCKCSSTNTNKGRQNNSNNISDSVLGYDNTTESVNMNTTDADENINNVVQLASNTNYNKAPIQPKHKAEHKRKSDKLGDLRKSVKSDFLQISAQSQDMRKSTKSVASNIDVNDVDRDVVIPLSTATEENYGYYNLDGLKKGIPVDKLAALVSKRDTANFEQEFKEFDNGLVRPYLDSQKPQNRARNRYQHIYPYDEHRVHLQGSSTDYINASYIDGYQHPKEYIACLGPTEKATEDFVIVWMMIWEQRVEKIVMVTNLFENAAMKCEQYWPDVTTSQNYGDVTVTCHSEDEYADYTLRSFTVSKGSENRSLHHIHYTAWPDKGVPDNVTSIIEFRQRVNSIQTKLRGPVIVHCSAGIGRTGTYIALDSLTKEGQYTQYVDIYGCVKKMREQRVNMVQTYEQYQYLHSAVVHSLTFDCAAVTAEQFNKHFKNINDKTIAEKFKQLQLTVENRSEEETKAIAVNKKHKHLNHAGADIPGDYRRPKLHLNKDTGDCDYINAVFVNSFKTKNRFIVAMTPLPGTVLDFLTLLYQENCSCIVSLEAPESLNDKNVGTYYPADNQELKHDVFKVTCTKGVPSDSYVMRKLTITYNKQAKSTSKTFTHFQFTKWSRRIYVPNDTATFLQLISDVEAKANATADNGPILIHCLNGASRSGLFCAVSILRQKMEIEHEVSVVNTVRYIKSRRPSAIPNKDQFAFCHQAVVAYLDAFDKDIYSNFSLKL